MKIVAPVAAAIVVVVVVLATAAWWFVLRDDAPQRAALPVRTEATTITTTTTTPGASASPTTSVQAATGSIEGTWTVVPAADVFVGYRIQELFGGETIEKTAVGRTPAVTGTLVVEGGQVTEVELVADVTRLASDRSQRDAFIRGSALETDRFGQASFRLTEPVAVPAGLEPGATVEVVARGELTLHGVVRPVELALQASWSGSAISVAGGTTIVLADHAIEAPDIALVAVDDVGELEAQLVFERS